MSATEQDVKLKTQKEVPVEMTPRDFDRLNPADLKNGAVLDEIRTALFQLEYHRNALNIIFENLKMIEQHCPCGANADDRYPHPHLTGCPVEIALVIARDCRDRCAVRERPERRNSP